MILCRIDQGSVELVADQGELLGGTSAPVLNAGAEKIVTLCSGCLAIATWGDWVFDISNGRSVAPGEWLQRELGPQSPMTEPSMIADMMRTAIESLLPPMHCKGGGFLIAGCEDRSSQVLELTGESRSVHDHRIAMSCSRDCTTLPMPLVRGCFSKWQQLAEAVPVVEALGTSAPLYDVMENAIRALPTILVGPPRRWYRSCPL